VISKRQVEGSGGATKGSAASFLVGKSAATAGAAHSAAARKSARNISACPPSNREIDRYAQGEVVDIVTLAARERLDSNAISFLEGN
jgi:hypothetical protein